MIKYRIKFIKEGKAAYISHLDLMRTMHRVFIRAGVRVRHSEGFNPHPKMVFAMPLSVGAESECELMDFELDNETDTSVLPQKLTAVMPEGITVTECYAAEEKFKEISWLRVYGRFEYDGGGAADKSAALKSFFDLPQIVIHRKTKRGAADSDIKPSVREIAFEACDAYTVSVSAVIAAGDRPLNPELLVSALEQLALELKPDFAKFRRIAMYKTDENGALFEFK
ncbi:MAG: TIGR03936 family radical SAM-associated protein [Oscillospiraceae bacterium]|nr:TIGR03936 family radical SAM-associated protein [Oscillospiraceae bacterium]